MAKKEPKSYINLIDNIKTKILGASPEKQSNDIDAIVDKITSSTNNTNANTYAEITRELMSQVLEKNFSRPA